MTSRSSSRAWRTSHEGETVNHRSRKLPITPPPGLTSVSFPRIPIPILYSLLSLSPLAKPVISLVEANMATKAHCVYAFDTLHNSLVSERAGLTLAETQVLWDRYTRETSTAFSKQDLTAQTAPPAETGPENEDDDAAASAQLSAEALRASQIEASGPGGRAGSASLAVPLPASRSMSSTPSSDASRSRSKGRLASLFSSTSHASSSSSSVSEGEVGGIRKSPLFVTWNVVREGRRGAENEKMLRGCIGTFEALELEDGLKSYALTAAFQDTRFNPIATSELPTLDVGITLLTDFEPCANPMDWTLGTHGLRLSFTHRGRRTGATYLPDVAVEQGWDKEETLVSLMRKAGWSGRSNEWARVGDLKAVRYQGSKVSMGYEAWRKWREWLEADGKK
ncbi:MAG: hypothetical protein M1814_004014 [Vezdaea aestivalis]|nr:MAG: hypothetical protein M1814_004014 [Vezdaea aestivalis]